MTPTQEFENYPEFANAGQKSQPNDAKYAAGFIPSDVLPAEWLNWFLNGATKGITALNTGMKSIEQEINDVLASRSVTPDINASGQLLAVLNKIKAEAVLAAHPVGSLYWTSKNENPAVTFGGGTWKQITDKFVLAAGGTYKAEATGGAAAVKLTPDNMPSHNHTFDWSGSHSHSITNSLSIAANGSHYHFTNASDAGYNTEGKSYSYPNNYFTKSSQQNLDNENAGSYTAAGKNIDFPPITSGINIGLQIDAEGNRHQTGLYNSNYLWRTNFYVSSWSGYHSHSLAGDVSVDDQIINVSGTTSESGSGAAFSVMPPYVVKYCWERTA